MSTTTQPTEQVTVSLTDEQAHWLRRSLLMTVPAEGPQENRESIAEHLERLTVALDRLDRLGWTDDLGTREYVDDRALLAAQAADLIQWGADNAQAGAYDDDDDRLAEARHRRQELVPALVGANVLEQLEATR